MDRLDRITLSALFMVALVMGGLFIGHKPTQDSQAMRRTVRSGPQMVNADLQKKMQVASDLLLAGNLEKAEGLLHSMAEQFPYEGHVYMLLADLYIHRQQPILAMLEHRKAIELNPDFLDKKTADFQGKKIKNNVEEAQTMIEEGQLREPQAEKWREYRKALYYMQRRIAGSCG